MNSRSATGSCSSPRSPPRGTCWPDTAGWSRWARPPFIGIGAYTATGLANGSGLPLPVLLLAAAGAGAAFATLVSPAMFRLRGLYFTIGTLALAEALRLLMINLPTFGGASGVLLTGAVPPVYALYWWSLAIAVLATVVVAGVMASPLSLSLRAVRDDEDVARQMGAVTFRTKLWAFAISAALIGMVGGLQSAKLGVIEPYGAFGLSWTVDVVAVAIIGGLGTRTGPWLGTVFVALVAQALERYPEIHLAVTGVVLLAVIRFAPLGIWGSAVHWYARLRSPRNSPRPEPELAR
jgi:branched-chain amino acid transport system permease protein